MFNKQISLNIRALDAYIGNLTVQLNEADDKDQYDTIVDKITKLTKLRSDLANDRAKESILPVVLSGSLQIAAILIVLNYEKTDVISSKAYGMATGLFKRGV